MLQAASAGLERRRRVGRAATGVHFLGFSLSFFFFFSIYIFLKFFKKYILVVNAFISPHTNNAY
jgi:hypothetical protein